MTPEHKLRQMYCDEGMTQLEIADIIDVSCSTVRCWMKKYGIKSRTCSESRLNGDFAGENNPNWKNGISFIYYCYKFNNTFKEAVRERDNYTCQLCGYKQNGRKLSVHHIHYDKQNCYPDVIALCQSCHGKTMGNKDYWEKYFEDLLIDRGLYCWSLSQET